MHLPLLFHPYLLRERHSAMQLHAPRIALAMLFGALCACSLGAHAQTPGTATSATLPVQATVTDRTVVELIAGNWASCADIGKVVVGRRYSPMNPNTNWEYRCGTVMYKGHKVEVRNTATGDWHDRDNATYFAPTNAVVSGAQTRTTRGFEKRYSAAELFGPQSERLNIRPAENYIQVEHDRQFDCPANSVLVGVSARTWYLCGEIWSGNPPPSTPSGAVILRGPNRPEDAPYSCALTVPNGPTGESWTYNFQSQQSSCSNNKIASIEMEQVASATRILLTDSERCQKQDDFWIELRTISKSVTFSLMNLDELLTHPTNTVVAPGLMLTGKHKKADAVEKLSCVRITTSSAPPSS